MKKNILLLIVALSVITYSCKKGPGQGGTTTITGKVWAEEWSLDFATHIDSLDHWEMDQDVYLVYGDDVTYSDRTKTSPAGVFEFRYMRAGDYVVYVYSNGLQTAAEPTGKPVISKRISISDGGTYDAGIFAIKK
jgi:hypothetical protein